MLCLKLGDHVEGLGVVRVEALDEVGVKLDLLELITVCHVLFALEFVIHRGETVNQGLATSISLGLRGGRWRRASTVCFAAHGSGYGSFARSHGDGRWVLVLNEGEI